MTSTFSYNILLVNLLRCGVLHSTKAVLTTVLPVGNIVSLSLVAHQVFEDETVLVTAPLIIEILTFYCVVFFGALLKLLQVSLS